LGADFPVEKKLSYSVMEQQLPALLNNFGWSAQSLLSALISAFLAVLFLQSGLDKVLDYKGNLSWLTGHFANSPLAGSVGILLPVITLTETAAGLFSGFGVVQLLAGWGTSWAYWGLLLSAVSLLMLFFGQRVAKDYAGAATLVPYFILTAFGLFLLS
jgi:hypothetical protein